MFLKVGEQSDMLKAPEGFPKCGNYIPPVANPPIYVHEKPQSIVPLQNGTNPLHPPYEVMSTASSPIENTVPAESVSKSTKKPKPLKGKGSAGSFSPWANTLIISIFISYISRISSLRYL